MKRRKFISISVGSAIVLTSFTGCNSLEVTENTPQEKPILTMITSPDYPPYEYYSKANDQKGEIIGFDIDIAKKITENLGYQLRIVESDFNGIIPALKANRVDFAMAGMTPTAERKKEVDFSDVYYIAKKSIVAKKADNIKQKEDLTGKRVGVQLGTTQEKQAKKIAEKTKRMQIVSFSTVPEIIEAINNGNLDAAILADVVAKRFVESNLDLEANIIPSEGEVGSAIAFPKGSPLKEKFNFMLNQLKNNGEIEEIASHWFQKEIEY